MAMGQKKKIYLLKQPILYDFLHPWFLKKSDGPCYIDNQEIESHEA